MSSLKESDQLKTNGKVMKQMQAREHSQLWLGLCSDKYDQFWAVNRRLMESSDAWRHLPVRFDFPQSIVVGGLECGYTRSTQHLKYSFNFWNIVCFRVYSGDNCAMTQRLVCPSATLADIKEQFSLPDNSSLVIQVSTTLNFTNQKTTKHSQARA